MPWKHEGLKRQGSLYVLAGFCVIVAAAVVVPRLWPQVIQACTEYTRVFSEAYDTVAYRDTALSSVNGWPVTVPHRPSRDGIITLPFLGSNFLIGAADSMGRRIYQCASGDFTGDGYPDLIGLDISGEFPVVAPNPWSELRLIRSNYPTNLGATPLFQVDMATSYDRFYNHTGPATMTSADYNGDGLLDFFFMRNSSDQFGYSNFQATMYINRGTSTAPDLPAPQPLPEPRLYGPLPDREYLPFLGSQPPLFRGHRPRRRHRHPGHQPGQDLPAPESRGRQLQHRRVQHQRAVLRCEDGLQRRPRRLGRGRSRFRRRRRLRHRRRHGRHGPLSRLLRERRNGTVQPQRAGHPERVLRRCGRHHDRRFHGGRPARHLRGHGLGLRQRPPGPYLDHEEPRPPERRDRLEIPVPQRLHGSYAPPLRHRHGDIARLRQRRRHGHRHRRRQPLGRLLLYRERAGRSL